MKEVLGVHWQAGVWAGFLGKDSQRGEPQIPVAKGSDHLALE